MGLNVRRAGLRTFLTNVALGLMFLPVLLVPVHAESASCDSIMQAMRIPQPEAEPTLKLLPPIADCTQAQSGMFAMNSNALARATPASPDQIYGTWLGDDVYHYSLGLTLPGQEVITIAEGSAPGEIMIRQAWFHLSYEAADAANFDDEGRWIPYVAKGVLLAADDPGSYRPDHMNPIDYPALPMSGERALDLWRMERINHFDGVVSFAVDGETLVLSTEFLAQPFRTPERRTATFSRVSPGAPDLAIATIDAIGLTVSGNFDCLTHQISEGHGPFIDALGPDGLKAWREHMAKLHVATSERNAFMARFKGQKPSQAEMDGFKELQTRIQDLSQSEQMTNLKIIAAGPATLCPPL
ncbi:MAG: hypothetical protein HC844_09510 [Tabrizicola sp.]|nr:hypothetical protein [Tabrizicola sp.]